LPADIVDQLGIYVVPLKVIFGTEEYRDGVDIKTKQFYERLSAGELSMSSPPAPVDFLKVYEKSIAANESIISIHISSQLSATLNSARTAKAVSGYEDITVIDSLSASSGLGLMVMAAARAANEGKTKEEIINLIKNVREKMKIYFVVDTLEYLIRGGRIGKIEGFVGSLFNIKPILTIKDGVILPFAKIMGKSRAVEKLLDIIAEDAGRAGENFVFSLIHGDDNAALTHLDQKIKTRLNKHEKTVSSEVGPVIGTHVGPRVVGLAYYAI
jgi:DegV family protein with EDD domain